MRVSVKLISEATFEEFQKLFPTEFDDAWDELWENYSKVVNPSLLEIFKKLTDSGKDWTTFKKQPRVAAEVKYKLSMLYPKADLFSREFSSLDEFSVALDAAIDGGVREVLEIVFDTVDAEMASSLDKKHLRLKLTNFINTRKQWNESLLRAFKNFVGNFDVDVKAPVESTEEDPRWGKYAFADDRKDAPYEPNTPSEDDAEKELSAHFDNRRMLSSDTAQQMKSFISSGQYTKLLKFPADKYEVIYRGISLTEDALERLLASDTSLHKKYSPSGRTLKIDTVDLASFDVGDEDVVSFHGHAKPRGDSASWTVDEEIAEEFSIRGFESEAFDPSERAYSVIISARVSDNVSKLLLNPDAIYNVRDFMNFKREQEVIGVGPIKVFSLKIRRVQ